MKFKRFVIRDSETGEVVYVGIEFKKQAVITSLDDSFIIAAEIAEIIWRFGSEDSGCYFQYIDDKDFNLAHVPGLVDGMLGSLG